MKAPRTPPRKRQEIFELIVQGKTNPEIARQLGISIHAVKTHLNLLYKDLRVKGRFEAMRHGIKTLPLRVEVDFSILDEEALQLANLVASGKSNEKIGRLLYFSESTVTKHIREQLFEPFGLKHRYAFTAAYLAWLQKNQT